MTSKKIITVGANQTIFDIALQEYGSVEAVFDVAVDNGLEGVNANINPGDDLVISTDKILNQDVVNYYIRTERKPASADTDVGAAVVGAGYSLGFTLGFDS